MSLWLLGIGIGGLLIQTALVLLAMARRDQVGGMLVGIDGCILSAVCLVPMALIGALLRLYVLRRGARG